MLAGAFEVLDDQEREIVFLRYIEDLDRKEVAERLGISESQIGRRTRTALAKLRRELEAREVPRWLPAAIVANIVVVAVAAIVAVVLLVIAWQNGW